MAALALAMLLDVVSQADGEEKFAPLPTKVPQAEGNPSTPGKVALGKQLFFDARLSGNNKISCATCHLPDKAFADGRATSLGFDGKPLARNAPSLVNAGFLEKLFWDGRADSLEQQALLPITSPDEMNQDLDQLEQELSAVPGYAKQFGEVFGGRVTRQGIAKALAAFQRSLVSGPSALDRFLAGDKDALSAAARRGMEAFTGEANCVRCHHGPLLSDGKFYRLGVSSQDKGLAAISGKPQDNYRFRTPSLRNVALTAPYMHNGSLKSLDDAVTFYYRGVPHATPEGAPLDVEPLLGQSFSDISDMVAFLKSLTGSIPRIEPPQLP